MEIYAMRRKTVPAQICMYSREREREKEMEGGTIVCNIRCGAILRFGRRYSIVQMFEHRKTFCAFFCVTKKHTTNHRDYSHFG